ncbi:outer membrane surface antigen [Pseudovibrio sp. Tun.PSC04-5.I4]|nr:outer membrane surface antigen [Pseudovibrio sp. Tun.PSC04-5.I4]
MAGSYSKFISVRQSRYTLVAILLALPACTQMSISVNNDQYQDPLNLTEAVDTKQKVAESEIHRTDRTIITNTIEAALTDNATTPSGFAPMAWINPISGNSGTITSLLSVDKTGSIAGCTDFVTSANTVGGVRAYQGRSCPDVHQKMKIIQLAPFQAEQIAAQ